MKQPSLSIIVPAYNEALNLPLLIKQIHHQCKSHNINYEIIVVDDRSSDNTKEVVNYFCRIYQVKYQMKQGRQGKAFALLEGFKSASYNTLVMIDADLQYSPLYIPAMLKEIKKGADIVVANRKTRKTTGLRNLLSKGFHTLFVKHMHKITVDSQSGLKIFKKEILSRITLNPKPWTFDLEFLVKAQDAGYKICGYDIEFKKRYAGSSKISIIKATAEIGMEALRLKFSSQAIYPFSPQNTKFNKGFHFRGTQYMHYSDLEMDETALFTLSKRQKELAVVFLTLSMIILMLNWHSAILIALILITYFYFIDSIFHLVIIFKGLIYSQSLKPVKSNIKKLTFYKWPTYTIFCPLYKEWQVLKQFVHAISKLDYPKDKLQVLLILEENDRKTIAHVKKTRLPEFFQVITVPHNLPKTKPKACNYALNYAKGEYAVIFDAEDKPEPFQLKKAVLAFKQSGPNVRCVQAKLNFYNVNQNWLTRFFTAEYSLWFHLILPGLQSLHAPIPLGGTSNHFKTADLIDLRGWDAFNVTEDCDLGIRLATRGYQTVMIDSVTFEEANSNVKNWFNQRSRWLKGYLQTYLVHMRKLSSLVNRGKFDVAAGIQFIVGGKVIALLINPIMWVTSVSYFAFRPVIGPTIESFFPPYIFYAGVLVLVFGNLLYVYYYMIALVNNRYFDLVKYVFFVPLYWLMISLAAWYALAGLIIRPHYWFKTTHGLHFAKNNRNQRRNNKRSAGAVNPLPSPLPSPAASKAYV